MSELRWIVDRELERVELRPFTLESFHRRRDRKRRKQRVTAGVVGIAMLVALVMLLGSLSSVDRTQTPAATGPTKATPGVFVIDQAFVDSINGCVRLLVTRQEVESALGLHADDPAPSTLHSYVGCKYALFSPDTGQSGGWVVINAWRGPALRLPGGEPVHGIGDDAEFTPWANMVPRSDPPRISTLQVRTGDLNLAFEAARRNAQGLLVGIGLPRLRHLAEYALTTLGEGT